MFVVRQDISTKCVRSKIQCNMWSVAFNSGELVSVGRRFLGSMYKPEVTQYQAQVTTL